MQTRAITLIAVALLGAALTTGQTAARDKGDEDTAGLDARAIDTLVLDTLRDVINRGADLYNGGELIGCYRLYEGALITVKPLLKHRPALQKAIGDGLVDAERNPVAARRAFVLRAVLDKVRKEVRPPKAEKEPGKKEPGKKEPETKEPEKKEPEKKEPEKKEPEKKEPEKKEPEKKEPEKKEPEKKEPDEVGTIKGKVTVNGEGLKMGLITFHSAKGKAVTALVAADAGYEVRGLEPGMVKVSVATVELLPTGAPPPKKLALVEVPVKYHDPTTSGLTVTIVKGAQVHDIALVDE
jgi:hypothetical protein